MKRINASKKLFNVGPETDLKSLKKTYRVLVKDHHPDKFQDEAEKAAAEIKSQEIIDAYHFLVSISAETKEATKDEYEASIATGIDDFQHKGQVLKITFLDGATYEYFGVQPKVFQKLINSDKQVRFCKRNVFTTYTYRKAKQDAVA